MFGKLFGKKQQENIKIEKENHFSIFKNIENLEKHFEQKIPFQEFQVCKKNKKIFKFVKKELGKVDVLLGTQKEMFKIAKENQDKNRYANVIPSKSKKIFLNFTKMKIHAFNYQMIFISMPILFLENISTFLRILLQLKVRFPKQLVIKKFFF